MSPLSELLDQLADTIKGGCGIEVSLRELPASGGIYAELSAGYPDAQYYDKTTIRIIPVLFLAKYRSQKECMDSLSAICAYLHKLHQFPQGETFAWLDATTATEPNKIGRQEDGRYIYSCIINCKIFY